VQLFVCKRAGAVNKHFGFGMHVEGETPVITAPAEIDVGNAQHLRMAIFAASYGQPLIVLDMSATSFCDSAGVGVLILSSRRVEADGGELRLIVSSPTVLQVMTLIGADRVLRIFPGMPQALNGGAEIVSLRPQSDGRLDGQH
jgi:anti-sigma B factor antagonist